MKRADFERIMSRPCGHTGSLIAWARECEHCATMDYHGWARISGCLYFDDEIADAKARIAASMKEAASAYEAAALVALD